MPKSELGRRALMRVASARQDTGTPRHMSRAKSFGR
jgi:hypothetical protein